MQRAEFNYWHVCVGCTTDLSLEGLICVGEESMLLPEFEFEFKFEIIFSQKGKGLHKETRSPYCAAITTLGQTSKDIK